ncbi:MAG: hypothetical protein EXS09_00745 [Gemmataceae bacterium]|nr:hypothetical protein [Gemmataceae bacterium]
MLNPLLRELHRLRKHLRDCQAEIERAPKLLKAHQAKLATTEKTVADARDELKKSKAGILTCEAQIKSLNQAIAKHEKQLDGLTAPRDITAKQHDINNSKALIVKQEDELMTFMTEVDERTLKLPEVEKTLVKAKADFATFEKDAVEKLTRMKEEVAEKTKALAVEEAKIPPDWRGQYDRLVKAYGADSMAVLENQSCTQCRVGITSQQFADLQRGHDFFCCRSCGRALYLPA